MAIEQLRWLKALLTNPPVEKVNIPNKRERAALTRKRDRMAIALHTELDILGEIMKDKSIGGRLDLGTNPEEVNWAAMPEEVAKCFWPEFGYQPEEITEFYLDYSDRGYDGEKSIAVRLNRNGQWWSYLTAGAIVRKHDGLLGGLECMGTSHITCFAPQAQPKLAREAMRELDEALWLDDSGRSIHEENRLSQTINDINVLRLGEDLLNFAMAEVQNRLPATPSGR